MDQELLTRVEQWLAAHRQDIISDLVGLVRIPSVSVSNDDITPPECVDALNYMFALAKRYGYASRNYDDRVGRIQFTVGQEEVGIWTHLDVVPVPEPAEWDYPPFEGTLVEGRYLIARGAQDNKGPAIGVLHVMNCLRELGVELRHGYSMYMGTSEETGMADARYFAARYSCPDLSIVPDTGFPVCCAQRGSATLELSVPLDEPLRLAMHNNLSVTPEAIRVTLGDGRCLTVKGHSAHVSAAQEAPNAVSQLLRELSKALPHRAETFLTLDALCAAGDGGALAIHFADKLSGALHMAPTRLSWRDDRLYATVFVILPVTCDADALLARAQTTAEARGARLTLLRLRKPCHFSMEHPAVSLLTDVYNDVMKQHSRPFVMSGGNYAACLPNAFGFGPGMPGQTLPPHIFRPGHGDYHQCDESEDIEHLLNFMRVYALSIAALDQLDTVRT